MNMTNREETTPSACPNCGSERAWQRNGFRSGRQQFKAACLQCHRASLANEREKHGGAAGRNRAWKSRNQENREKAKAHARVARHLKTGNIRKKPCERCGSLNVHAHHDDYSYPLEVMWLCPKHHWERHRELESARADSSPALTETAGMVPLPSVPAGQFKAVQS